MKYDGFLFGAAYYDEYMPYERVQQDMELLRNAGMNVIRIAESTWSTWEPEDGVFDFTHLHHMLEAAEKNNINVIVGTPTYAIPAWLAKKYPDILAFNKNGQEIYGHRQLTDITNPDYLRHSERIIRRLMEEVMPYSCVIGFQLDNETRSAGAASKATQALFIDKMKQKYPDIEAFNHEFGLDYWSNRIADWDDFPDIRGTINGSLSAAYKRFLRDCITEFLTWQSNILREYMKPEQFITHNFDFSWTSHSFGIQPEVNQFDAVKCMDIAGVDIYHPSQDALTGAEIAFGGTVARSLKKDNYFVLETQSQGNLEWLPYPGQLRLQAYSHLSSGANSVMYWNWHSIHNSFESYWKGILSHNLTPGAAYEELAAFGKEVQPIINSILNLKKDCNVAILVNNESLTGLDEFPISDHFNYNHIVRWFFDACYKMNIECDNVSIEDDFSRYTVLLVPALYSASEETLRKLNDYAAQGGHLVLGFKSGFSDEELKIYHDNQPHLLTDCIGAAYDQFTRPVNVSASITGEADSYHVSEWMELLIPKEAEVWARYEHPYWKQYAAVTHHTFFNGSATYIGCYMEEKALQLIFKKVFLLAGIDLTEYTFPLIVKSGKNKDNKMIRYYFNYSNNAVTFTYHGTLSSNLLTKENYKEGDTLTISPWDLIITEELEPGTTK